MADQEDDFDGLSDITSPPPTTKRKREDDDDDGTKTQSKRSLKRKKSKKATHDDDSLDTTLGVNHAIAHMDPTLLSDHLAQRTKRFQPSLSLFEAEELHIPCSAITDTTSFSADRTTAHLPQFLETFAGPRRKRGLALNKASKQNGAPHTIVVAGAGLRAADLTRALRRFQTKDCAVAKLFAKHIKLQEAIESAKKTRIGIGVGTPQRISDLLDDGVLSSQHLERIIIDASHIDQKKRGVLDMQDTQPALMRVLVRKELHGRTAREQESNGSTSCFF